MNDNPVVLNQTHIRLNVSENTAIGTELTRIYATDNDIGLNGKVRQTRQKERRKKEYYLHFEIDSLFD